MIYNKEEYKGGRILKASGPRNMQTRASSVEASEDIKELKAEISKLAQTKNITTSGYSQQQVDDMINEAIGSVSIDLEKKYISEINNLNIKLSEANNLIKDLTQTLNKKNETIDIKDKALLELTTKFAELASRPSSLIRSNDIELREEPTRPSIDSVYIDPTKKGSAEKMESHISTKEIKTEERVSTSDSLSKLKGLLGKSPVKF